jgi:hypothetical protein
MGSHYKNKVQIEVFTVKLRKIYKGKVPYYPRISKCEHLCFTDVTVMCAEQWYFEHLLYSGYLPLSLWLRCSLLPLLGAAADKATLSQSLHQSVPPGQLTT